MKAGAGEPPAGTTIDTRRWRQPRWLIVGGSLLAAVLALLSGEVGGALEHAALAAGVAIVCAWALAERPVVGIAVPAAAAVVVAFGWLGGRPEAALFQPVLLAAGIGWRVRDPARSFAAVALLALAPPLGALAPNAEWDWWNWSIGVVMMWTTGHLVGRLERALAELTEARSRLVTAAAMEERRRIALDVHDLVGHSLTAMLLNIRAARQSLDSDPFEAGRALDDAVQIGTSGLADVRASVLSLREPSAGEIPGAAAAPTVVPPAALAAVPDGKAIRALLARRDDVRASIDGPLEILDGSLAVAVCRVLQECLTNIARHAVPGSATLSLHVSEDAVVLAADNAIATVASTARPDETTHRTFGLIGMRERFAALGGHLEARRVGDRWRVDGEVPRR